MNTEEVKDWMTIADSDFDSAKILHEAPRKYYEIICYHCAQAVEKYLKSYLVYHDILPEKTQDLIHLNRHCVNIDSIFQSINTKCGFLNRFANNIRYPHPYETGDTDANFAIDAVEKIRNFKPVLDLRNLINEIQYK